MGTMGGRSREDNENKIKGGKDERLTHQQEFRKGFWQEKGKEND
jgi:hypothetical protein